MLLVAKNENVMDLEGVVCARLPCAVCVAAVHKRAVAWKDVSKQTYNMDRESINEYERG